MLDRDGTLNALAPGYRTPDDFALLPGAVDAVARLSAAGCAIVVVTNQQGLATGRLTWAQLSAVNARLIAEVDAAGGRIDDVRLCPHAADTCVCRKPAPGLLCELFDENPHVSRERIVMVGDAETDAAAAAAAGVQFMRCEPTIGLAGVVDSLVDDETGTIPSRW
nr:HAD-IIIA family hydrolase [Dermacoccus nishinomiyaensis]